MYIALKLNRDFFLDKKREKQKLEAEMKLRVTLKQLIPAGEAKPVAPLGVILSQYYLNLTEFSNNFNALTKHFEEGIILPVIVKKALRAKEYKLFINPPTVSFLISNIIDPETYILTYLSLWDVVRLKAIFNNISEYEASGLVFSSLKSFNYIRVSFKKIHNLTYD